MARCIRRIIQRLSRLRCDLVEAVSVPWSKQRMAQTPHAFQFKYVGLRIDAPGCGFRKGFGRWVGKQDQQVSLFGRIHEGCLDIGAPVFLPTSDGTFVEGYIARFCESFSEGSALPFYNTATKEGWGDAAFCLCIGTAAEFSDIHCPGVAAFPRPLSSTQEPPPRLSDTA